MMEGRILEGHMVEVIHGGDIAGHMVEGRKVEGSLVKKHMEGHMVKRGTHNRERDT